jgi:hypothetical protein
MLEEGEAGSQKMNINVAGHGVNVMITITANFLPKLSFFLKKNNVMKKILHKVL